MTPVGARPGLIVAALAATIAFHAVLGAAASKQRRVIVEIRRFKFVPESVVVRSGDVVVWRNMDIVPHTATSSDGRWDSGGIGAAAEWTTVVTAAMRGRYYCRFHPSMAATLDFGSE